MAVSGSNQLRDLGLRLKAMSTAELDVRAAAFQATGTIVSRQAVRGATLRRNLLAGIRAGAQPLIGDVRAAARAELPKSGGLNEFVANSSIRVRTRLTGRNVGVQIANSRPSKKGGTHDFGSDRGQVRHPVYGHRKRKWAVTEVQPGWFSKTLEEKSPETTPFVYAAMELTAREIMFGG